MLNKRKTSFPSYLYWKKMPIMTALCYGAGRLNSGLFNPSPERIHHDYTQTHQEGTFRLATTCLSSDSSGMKPKHAVMEGAEVVFI